MASVSEIEFLLSWLALLGINETIVVTAVTLNSSVKSDTWLFVFVDYRESAFLVMLAVVLSWILWTLSFTSGLAFRIQHWTIWMTEDTIICISSTSMTCRRSHWHSAPEHLFIYTTKWYLSSSICMKKGQNMQEIKSQKTQKCTWVHQRYKLI